MNYLKTLVLVLLCASVSLFPGQAAQKKEADPVEKEYKKLTKKPKTYKQAVTLLLDLNNDLEPLAHEEQNPFAQNELLILRATPSYLNKKLQEDSQQNIKITDLGVALKIKEIEIRKKNYEEFQLYATQLLEITDKATHDTTCLKVGWRLIKSAELGHPGAQKKLAALRKNKAYTTDEQTTPANDLDSALAAALKYYENFVALRNLIKRTRKQYSSFSELSDAGGERNEKHQAEDNIDNKGKSVDSLFPLTTSAKLVDLPNSTQYKEQDDKSTTNATPKNSIATPQTVNNELFRQSPLSRSSDAGEKEKNQIIDLPSSKNAEEGNLTFQNKFTPFTAGEKGKQDVINSEISIEEQIANYVLLNQAFENKIFFYIPEDASNFTDNMSESSTATPQTGNQESAPPTTNTSSQIGKDEHKESPSSLDIEAKDGHQKEEAMSSTSSTPNSRPMAPTSPQPLAPVTPAKREEVDSPMTKKNETPTESAAVSSTHSTDKRSKVSKTSTTDTRSKKIERTQSEKLLNPQAARLGRTLSSRNVHGTSSGARILPSSPLMKNKGKLEYDDTGDDAGSDSSHSESVSGSESSSQSVHLSSSSQNLHPRITLTKTRSLRNLQGNSSRSPELSTTEPSSSTKGASPSINKRSYSDVGSEASSYSDSESEVSGSESASTSSRSHRRENGLNNLRELLEIEDDKPINIKLTPTAINNILRDLGPKGRNIINFNVKGNTISATHATNQKIHLTIHTHSHGTAKWYQDPNIIRDILRFVRKCAPEIEIVMKKFDSSESQKPVNKHVISSNFNIIDGNTIKATYHDRSDTAHFSIKFNSQNPEHLSRYAEIQQHFQGFIQFIKPDIRDLLNKVDTKKPQRAEKKKKKNQDEERSED